jgi:PD-(D/E)XK nuclease family transposase
MTKKEDKKDKKPRELISFDYALKYMFRKKSEFVILEGFLTDLLEKPITVIELLESESNVANIADKYNRVDLLVKDANNDIYIIELQYAHQTDYIERMIYGTSKAIIDHMQVGEPYSKIRKVISISIVHFTLFDKGNCKDSIVHNSVEFRGLHDNEPVRVRSYKNTETKDGKNHVELEIYNPFPEYYFLTVNDVGDDLKRPIDEWLFMFKHSYFKKQVKSTNIEKSEEMLNYLKLTAAQKKIYDKEKDGIRRNISVMRSSLEEGFIEGREAGKAEAEHKAYQEKISMAKEMKLEKISNEKIAKITKLTIDEIQKL